VPCPLPSRRDEEQLRRAATEDGRWDVVTIEVRQQRRASAPGRLERRGQPLRRLAVDGMHGQLGRRTELGLYRRHPPGQLSGLRRDEHHGQPAPAQPVGELGEDPQRRLGRVGVGRAGPGLGERGPPPAQRTGCPGVEVAHQ
jgi:hypothetical protein